MDLKKGYLFIFTLLLWSQLSAQDVFFLIGSIKDADSKTPIFSAHIVNLKNNKGAITNKDGLFMIQASESDYLKISYLGYHSLYFQAHADGNDTLDFLIRKKNFELKEVEVYPWTREEFRHEFVHKDIKKDSLYWLEAKINLSREELRWITPVSFHNYKTSKEKQEIRLRALKAWIAKDEIFRKSIVRMTNYKDLELEDFIRYCQFSKQFVMEAKTYYLTSAMRQKYIEFEDLKKSKTNSESNSESNAGSNLKP